MMNLLSVNVLKKYVYMKEEIENLKASIVHQRL